MRPLPAFLVMLPLALAGCAAAVSDPPARPIRAVDGDTLVLCHGPAAPDCRGEKIRVVGVDTPELHHARCAGERTRAEAARVFTQAAVNGARDVAIERRQRPDKYGRTLAVIRLDGADLAAMIVAAGMGRPYDGRGRRQSWCG